MADRSGQATLTFRFALPSLTRSDWLTIATLSAAFFVVVGVCAVAIGLLMTPLMSEFHWQNSTTSSLATVFSLAALLASPLAGLVIDKFGERLALVSGVAATGAGFLGVGVSHALSAFYASFTLIGIGYGAAFFLAAQALVAKRMGEQKNFAMGVVFGAGAVGAAFFSTAIAWSLAHFGWRLTAYSGAALMMATLPFLLGFIREDTPLPTGGEDNAAPAQRTTPWKLVLAPFFLVMTLATAFASFGMGGINFHVVPILLNAGYKPGLASAAFGSSWILSGVGSLIAGTVATKYGAGRVFAVSLLIGAVGTCLLMFVANANIGGLSLWLFVVFWGLTANALNQFVPVIFMEEFGPEHLAGLVGIQSALMGLVSSFAPTATGALYDLFAGYQAAIIASTITTLLGCVLVFACRRLACLSAAPRPAGRA